MHRRIHITCAHRPIALIFHPWLIWTAPDIAGRHPNYLKQLATCCVRLVVL